MFAGTALSVRLLVYAGLSLFIINGPYVYMVVCVVYAYNLTVSCSSGIFILLFLSSFRAETTPYLATYCNLSNTAVPCKQLC